MGRVGRRISNGFQMEFIRFFLSFFSDFQWIESSCQAAPPRARPLKPPLSPLDLANEPKHRETKARRQRHPDCWPPGQPGPGPPGPPGPPPPKGLAPRGVELWAKGEGLRSTRLTLWRLELPRLEFQGPEAYDARTWSFWSDACEPNGSALGPPLPGAPCREDST